MPVIREARLFDDPIMRACFQNYPDCVRLVARIVLNNPSLDFMEKVPQKHITNPKGKSVIMDYYFKDNEGKIYNIEIENSNSNHPSFFRRARYYSSMLDSENLNKGEGYEKLPDSYVIFLCEKDPIGKGLPLYTLQTYISENKEEPVYDGRTIIYVNGDIEDDTALGKLVKDFKCTEPEDLCYNEIKEFYREEQDMIRAYQLAPYHNPDIQAIAEAEEAKGFARGITQGISKGIAQSRAETARNMLQKGLDERLVAECTSLSIEQVRKLKK